MVRSHRNSICDTCVQISRSYEFFDILAYIVVISSKTVKSAKNTICDCCAQISKKYEFCDNFANTVVKSCKKVKSSKKTIWDTCAQKSWSFVFCYIFAPYYNCMSENVTKHKTPRLLCTSVPNRLLR